MLLSQYRVDRISSLKIISEGAESAPSGYSVEGYIQQNFRMFAGDPTEVVLECGNEVMRSIIDRFGIDAVTWKSSETTFRTKVTVGDSPMFYGWVFASGGKVRIISPEKVKERYRQLLQQTLENI